MYSTEFWVFAFITLLGSAGLILDFIFDQVLDGLFEFLDVNPFELLPGLDELPGVTLDVPESEGVNGLGVAFSIFLTFFGGLGWINTIEGGSLATTLVLSLIGGYFAGYIAYQAVRFFRRFESPLGTFTESDLVGLSGRVITNVPAGGFGESMFNVPQFGNRTYPTTHADGEELPRNTLVRIVEVESGRVTVRRQGEY